MSNLEEARSKCEYAGKLLTEAKIPYQIKNADIGHINIYYRSKPVISFWARTGKTLFTMNTEWFEKNKITNNDLDRGIKNLIFLYKQYFKEENDGKNNDN